MAGCADVWTPTLASCGGWVIWAGCGTTGWAATDACVAWARINALVVSFAAIVVAWSVGVVESGVVVSAFGIGFDASSSLDVVGRAESVSGVEDFTGFSFGVDGVSSAGEKRGSPSDLPVGAFDFVDTAGAAALGAGGGNIAMREPASMNTTRISYKNSRAHRRP